MTKSIDWCAGLFEGEGCLYLGLPDSRKAAKHNSKNIGVSICMTDGDTLQEFVDSIGVGRMKGPYKHASGNPNHKDFYRWQIQKYTDVYVVLNRLLPFFMSRRRAKALELLAYCETRIKQQQERWKV